MRTITAKATGLADLILEHVRDCRHDGATVQETIKAVPFPRKAVTACFDELVSIGRLKPTGYQRGKDGVGRTVYTWRGFRQ